MLLFGQNEFNGSGPIYPYSYTQVLLYGTFLPGSGLASLPPRILFWLPSGSELASLFPGILFWLLSGSTPWILVLQTSPCSYYLPKYTTFLDSSGSGLASLPPGILFGLPSGSELASLFPGILFWLLSGSTPWILEYISKNVHPTQVKWTFRYVYPLFTFLLSFFHPYPRQLTKQSRT